MRVLVFAALALAAATASAQVYRWTDENGKVHYGDKPPAGKPAAAIAPPSAPAAQPNTAQKGTTGTTREYTPPPMTAEEAARYRRYEEQANKQMDAREEQERAALRAKHCPEVERGLRDAQQGVFKGRRLTPAEQKEVLAMFTNEQAKHCR